MRVRWALFWMFVGLFAWFGPCYSHYHDGALGDWLGIAGSLLAGMSALIGFGNMIAKWKGYD